MNKMFKALLALITMVGVSNASTTLGEQKIDQVSKIDNDSILLLEHTKDYQKMNNSVNQELAYHYSHRSHSSHRSHYSHYSGY